MDSLVLDIEGATLDNTYFRKVILTNEHSQLVLMSIKPGQEIGMEVHENNDQFIRIESGSGYAQLENDIYDIYDGVSVTVPAGTYHNITNTSPEDMKLYTIYSPPLHDENESLINNIHH